METNDDISKEYLLAQIRIQKSKYIRDLSCGNKPHPKAKVGVDKFIEPIHRSLGAGAVIDEEKFTAKGVTFVKADLENVPFEDHEFDFSYSHHAIEHVNDPQKACKEIMRISKSGVIICPSIFAEIAFGRPYHQWLVIARQKNLCCIKKTKAEDRPFGESPQKIDGRYVVTDETNPFDMLLNDGNWYNGPETMPRLSKIMRKNWYAHSPVMEVVFNWRESFNCIVIDDALD